MILFFYQTLNYQITMTLSSLPVLLLLLPLLSLAVPIDQRPIMVPVSDCSNYTAFLKVCQKNDDIFTISLEKRLAQFTKNCLNCIDQNQQYDNKTGDYKCQLHCFFSDIPEEDRSKSTSLRTIQVPKDRKTELPKRQDGKVSGTVIPTSLNYVTQGYVTSVKNQGSCGGCWSFASIGMYESHLLKRGFSYGLSEQAPLECTSYYAPGQRKSDCSGGYFQDPLNYLGKVGSVLRSNYPYISGSYGSGAGYPTTKGICNDTNRIMVGSGKSSIYGPLTATQVKTLLVEYGPVMVGVYANTAFSQYGGGIFTGCPVDSANFINHAVLLVGYNDATGSWLLKNQWTSSWGESGYMRVSYSRDCGLTSLLGNVVFSTYNANPSVTVDSSLLFSNGGTNNGTGKWQHALSLAVYLLMMLTVLVL